MANEMHRFKISGIDRESQFETDIVVEASTEANARAKAELRGVVVTAIDQLDKPLTDADLYAEQAEHLGASANHAPVRAPERKTDQFAVVAFATGVCSLLVLPIILAPTCYVFSILSYFRLKENPHLKGKGLRLTGAICGAISMLYLIYLFNTQPDVEWYYFEYWEFTP